MDSSELRRLFVLANAFKEGDLLVGGTADDRVRADARRALADLRLVEIHQTPIVDDGVTATLTARLARHSTDDVNRRTVGELKAILLGPAAADFVRRHRDGLGSEAIAAIVKVMTNDELSQVARAIFNPLPADGSNAVAIGSPQHFGSRIQPNSPGDNDDEILFSILEGLAYGCGDVIIGLNPAPTTSTRSSASSSAARTRRRAAGAVPTRYCVLSDIVKQQRAHATDARRRRIPESRRHVRRARRDGWPRYGRRPRSGADLRRPLLRNRTRLGDHQRRRRRGRHGDARGAHVRRGARTSSARPARGRSSTTSPDSSARRCSGAPINSSAPASRTR